MNIKLNKRLETVASFVDDNSNVIDVGCDHALLTIYLVQTKKNIKALASDINEGPLEGAKKNISKYHLEEFITPKLGRGIDTIEDDTDTIIISGMGGLNIIGILKYKPLELKKIKKIIVSPNNEIAKVRKELSKLGFYISDEKLVKDKNIIYPVLVWKKGRKHYNKNECLFGPILINTNEPLFIEYMTKQKEVKEKLLYILPKKYLKKRIQLKRELKAITRIL